MMQTKLPIKKLGTTALLLSPLIGAIAMSPAAVINSASLANFINGLVHFTLLSLLIWGLNIFLVLTFNRIRHISYLNTIRYLASYALSLVVVVPILIVLKPSFPTGQRPSQMLFITQNAPHGHINIFGPSILGLVFNTMVVIIIDLIILKFSKESIEHENTQLKLKSIEATNFQLKQQIQPHFLFNALNTLKSLIRKHPDQAEEYLVRLSDFLRVSVSSEIPNVILLKDEAKHCFDYLELQKMRFGTAMEYTINIPDHIMTTKYIPFFSLLSLVENAIKHNSFTREFPLVLKTEHHNGWIVTTNNIQEKSIPEPSTRLGLSNLRERYRILSGDEVVIHREGKIFSVSIKLLEDEGSYN